MKRGVVGWLVGFFLLTMLAGLVTFNLTKSRILVLHTGQRDNGWVQRVDDGMRRVLEKNRSPLSVQRHYLGMERFNNEEERQEAAQLARRAIQQIRPDVLIAVDDEAQAYVARHYAVPAGSVKAGRSPMRVVFAGINQEAADYGYAGAANVTGILERLPLRALRETLTTLAPSRSGRPARIAVIAPDDETAHGQMAQVQGFDWGPHQLVGSYNLPYFADWQALIPTLKGRADALIVLSFGGIPQSAQALRPTTQAEVASWIEANASMLPLGIGTSFVENGGGLAIAPSPREMGEVAMTRALDWLQVHHEGPLVAPPLVTNQHYRVALRESALRARGIELPSVYQEAARLDKIYFP